MCVVVVEVGVSSADKDDDDQEDDEDCGMLEAMAAVVFTMTGGTMELILVLVLQLEMLGMVVGLYFSGSSVQSCSGSNEDDDMPAPM